MKKPGLNYNTKHYPTSKRRGKSKIKDSAAGYMNYRTSTSSCSNHSYLNNSMVNNPGKGAAYTDIFPVRCKRANKRQLNNQDEHQVIPSKVNNFYNFWIF